MVSAGLQESSYTRMKTGPIDFVVLIPCYNNQKGLSDALQSISYPPEKFEVLIVDDGSTVPLEEQDLKKHCRALIRVIRLDQNRGILSALNTGLNVLKQRTGISYIARLDAGDSCHEQRFYKQVDYLDKHPDIALLASWARFENTATGKGYDYITKTRHEDIVKEMHYKCSFIHPSVMFRKEILANVGVYPDQYPHAEDYAFFWRILKAYKGAVLPEKLVTISFSEKNVSAENYKKQLNSRKGIVKDFGDSNWYRMIGTVMLKLRCILPLSWILKLKSG